MNKRAAKARVYTGTLTIGELRAYVRAGSRDGIASLNAGMTKAQAAEIFDGALKGRADEEVIQAETYSSFRNRNEFSRDALLASNILREFA